MMPLHDWTLVDAGIFHSFHTVWIGAVNNALNEGILPQGYYALAEQHAGRTIADVLTLHATPAVTSPLSSPPATGGTAVAEAPPRVRRKLTIESAALGRRRTLAIRRVSGHRLVALMEIVSPANKDCARHVEEFVDKAEAALAAGVHLHLVDLFPPGLHDPEGMHGAVLARLEAPHDLYDAPADEPLTLASYVADVRMDVYVEHLAVGAAMPEMPLFLDPDRYVNVPLESTYQTAYRGTPAFWRNVLEGRKPQFE
jgi:hypothetical protein